MQRQEAVKQIVRILQQHTTVPVEEASTLEELCIESLEFITVLWEIESALDRTVEMIEFSNIKTVTELAQLFI